jgi:hypothetical protein
MVTNDDVKDIMNTLNSFFNELNEWEKNCNIVDKDKTVSSEEIVARQKEKLSGIFNNYCTKKDRAHERPNVFSYSTENINNNQKIVHVRETEEANTAIAETDEDPFIYQFTLIRIKNRWLLDSKKRYSRWQKKWIIESL